MAVSLTATFLVRQAGAKYCAVFTIQGEDREENLMALLEGSQGEGGQLAPQVSHTISEDL